MMQEAWFVYAERTILALAMAKAICSLVMQFAMFIH